MRTQRERRTINHFLANRGLPTLDEPGSLMAAMGFLMKDHEEFRKLLNKCEPAERHSMYESLRPHLSFEPKPLDVYIAQLGQEAEARQMPTIAADGTLEPFHVPEIRTAIAAELGKFHLNVVCRKCTKAATFSGFRKADCIQELRSAGWVYDELKGEGHEICPDCPGATN